MAKKIDVSNVIQQGDKQMNYTQINKLGKDLNNQASDIQKLVRRHLDLFMEHSQYLLARTDGCGSSSAEALEDALFQRSDDVEKLHPLLKDALDAILVEERDEPTVVGHQVSVYNGDLTVESEEIYGTELTVAMKIEAEFDADGSLDEIVMDASQVPESIREDVRDAIENSEVYIYCRLNLKGLVAEFNEIYN
jgi:hypothetical protein